MKMVCGKVYCRRVDSVEWSEYLTCNDPAEAGRVCVLLGENDEESWYAFIGPYDTFNEY